MKRFLPFLICALMPVLATAQQRQACSPKVTSGQVCGAQLWSQNIVACPPDGPTPGHCVITLDFLSCVSGKDEVAIRINPGDSVRWYSDKPDPYGKPYQFKFDKFKQLKKSDHTECVDPKNGDPDLFKKVPTEGYAYAHNDDADQSARACTCYKHVIKLKDSKGMESDFDPHVIIGDGTSYFSAITTSKKSHAQANKPDSDKKKQK